MSTAPSKRKRVTKSTDAPPPEVQALLDDYKPLERVAREIVASVNSRDLPACRDRLGELLGHLERSILDGAPGSELRHQTPAIVEANLLAQRMGHSFAPFEIETATGDATLIYTMRFRITQPVYGKRFDVLLLAHHSSDPEQPYTVGWSEEEKREAIAAIHEWRAWAGRTTGPVVNVPYEDSDGLNFAHVCYSEATAILRGVKVAERKPKQETPIKTSGVAYRNKQIVEWYHDKTATTYHSPATIRDRWNDEHPSEKLSKGDKEKGRLLVKEIVDAAKKF